MKVVMFSGLLMVVGGYFDSWWHVNVGRESFWIPPHLVIYSGLVTVLAGLAFVLVIEKPGIFKWIAIAGFFMMFSAAPIDDWWHLTHPPEVGLALMSPPHMYFAVGGALVGFSVMNMLANMSIRTPGLRKYLFVYILAGYLMSMQAIGLMDPGDPTALGYVGSALFFSVPAGFYIFAKKAFSDRHVIGMGSVEGCAKTLLEGSLLYFPALFASSVFVSRFGPLRDTYAHHFLFGAMVGAVTSTYLIFFVDSLGAAVVLQRAIIGVVCAGLAGLLANFAARELFRNYRWIKSG
ncbi:MAG: hypothetical protein HY833_00335 [Candidatus Aenigmarchaeota archaeon]|nr:hypothetical protein [Candidatus Aenigmarchaeota archaeon]